MQTLVVDYIERKIQAVNLKHCSELAFVDSVMSVEAMREFDDFCKSVESSKLSELQKEYRKFFREKLAEFEAITPADLTDKEKLEFFKAVKDGWVCNIGPVEHGEAV